jgi:hypothetical protein
MAIALCRRVTSSAIALCRRVTTSKRFANVLAVGSFNLMAAYAHITGFSRRTLAESIFLADI